MQRRAGLVAFGDEQILIAAMRVDGFGFNLHIAKLDRPAGVHDRARQLRLRLERDHSAITDPAGQPIDETALVGPDVADDIARPDVPPDEIELGLLITKPRLQRANPKPDTLGRKPGMDNGHRSDSAA